jgi:hypothetical protein
MGKNRVVLFEYLPGRYDEFLVNRQRWHGEGAETLPPPFDE